MKRIGYIDGRRLSLLDGHAISFGTDKDIAVSFNASLNALEFGGNILLPTDKQLFLRDSGVFIRSHVDGRIQIQADDTGTGAIALNAGAGLGSIALWGYLRLLITDTPGTTANQMWIDDSEQALKYVDGLTGVPVTVALLERAQTFSQNQTFGVKNAESWRLYFRDTGVCIYSHVDGRIRIEADGSTGSDINLHTPHATGGISLGGYLKLLETDADAPTSNIGALWFDSSEGALKFRKDSGTVKTVAGT